MKIKDRYFYRCLPAGIDILLETKYPVAVDSLDHTAPQGTMYDNSRNRKFNDKLYKLFNGKQIRLLDLGCSGGGFVKDCIDDGHIAYGLEGSDYSLLNKRAEWANIPNNLWTCDISKSFSIIDVKHNVFGKWRYYFDVITAWEVLEHINEEDLNQVIDNCLNHLKPDGLMIFSISLQPAPWHVTLKERKWWINFFESKNLKNNYNIIDYFDRDWIRGPYQGAPGSFHVVLNRRNSASFNNWK